MRVYFFSLFSVVESSFCVYKSVGLEANLSLSLFIRKIGLFRTYSWLLVIKELSLKFRAVHRRSYVEHVLSRIYSLNFDVRISLSD